MRFQNLYKQIEKSNKIVVTAHVSPDLDAFCSSLLVYNFIKNKWSEKQVFVNIQGCNPKEISFLVDYESLTNLKTLDLLKKERPDLFIMVDANNFLHFSGSDGEIIRKYITENDIKTAILDHHPETYKEKKVDYYVNRSASSASEEVYRLFVHDFGLPPFKGAADTTMYGILADTNRFMYKNPNHKKTFKIVSELLEQGVIIEQLWNKVFDLKFSYNPIFAELLKNMQTKDSYNFSYISVEFAKEYVDQGGSWEDFSNAYYLWGDLYIRYVGKNTWGYTIAPDFSKDINNITSFRGSFRALKDVDTCIFAKELGGGGHKLASGFSVVAKTHEEALYKVDAVIAKTK